MKIIIKIIHLELINIEKSKIVKIKKKLNQKKKKMIKQL